MAASDDDQCPVELVTVSTSNNQDIADQRAVLRMVSFKRPSEAQRFPWSVSRKWWFRLAFAWTSVIWDRKTLVIMKVLRSSRSKINFRGPSRVSRFHPDRRWTGVSVSHHWWQYITLLKCMLTWPSRHCFNKYSFLPRSFKMAIQSVEWKVQTKTVFESTHQQVTPQATFKDLNIRLVSRETADQLSFSTTLSSVLLQLSKYIYLHTITQWISQGLDYLWMSYSISSIEDSTYQMGAMLTDNTFLPLRKRQISSRYYVLWNDSTDA